MPDKEHPARNEQQPAEPVMLNVDGVAAILACSPRTVYRLAGSGRLPAPVKIGSLVRWSRQIILTWIANGCPRCQVGRS